MVWIGRIVKTLVCLILAVVSTVVLSLGLAYRDNQALSELNRKSLAVIEQHPKKSFPKAIPKVASGS